MYMVSQDSYANYQVRSCSFSLPSQTGYKGKGVHFYLQALSAKGWSPKGSRGKGTLYL